MSEDDEFMFDLCSSEYLELKKLAKDWCKATNITGFSNSTDGEIGARNFEKFVCQKYPQIAVLVARDKTIYEAVLQELNGCDSDDDDQEEEDNDDHSKAETNLGAEFIAACNNGNSGNNSQWQNQVGRDLMNFVGEYLQDEAKKTGKSLEQLINEHQYVMKNSGK